MLLEYKRIFTPLGLICLCASVIFFRYEDRSSLFAFLEGVFMGLASVLGLAGLIFSLRRNGNGREDQ